MNNVEKIKPTGLFTNYIYKAIPLAFDESMSYYETLCGLLSYLKNTVIPALNNNADSIIELQNLITELQNYVDNYFDNLDVQQEINNKLDEMAQNGTLADIINNELFTKLNDKIDNTVLSKIDFKTLSNLIFDESDLYNGHSHTYIQGMCCTTENKILFALVNEEALDNYVKLVDYNYSTQLIDRISYLELYHANSLSFDIENNQIFVAYCNTLTNNEGTINFAVNNTIGVVNYQDLTLIDTIDVLNLSENDRIRSVYYNNTSKKLYGADTTKIFEINTQTKLIVNTIQLEETYINTSITNQTVKILNDFIITFCVYYIGIFTLEGKLIKIINLENQINNVNLSEYEDCDFDNNNNLILCCTYKLSNTVTFRNIDFYKTNIFHNINKTHTENFKTYNNQIQTIYVDNTSTANYENGTSDYPYKTIQKALNVLKNYVFIYITGDYYDFTSINGLDNINLKLASNMTINGLQFNNSANILITTNGSNDVIINGIYANGCKIRVEGASSHKIKIYNFDDDYSSISNRVLHFINSNAVIHYCELIGNNNASSVYLTKSNLKSSENSYTGYSGNTAIYGVQTSMIQSYNDSFSISSSATQHLISLQENSILFKKSGFSSIYDITLASQSYCFPSVVNYPTNAIQNKQYGTVISNYDTHYNTLKLKVRNTGVNVLYKDFELPLETGSYVLNLQWLNDQYILNALLEIEITPTNINIHSNRVNAYNISNNSSTYYTFTGSVPTGATANWFPEITKVSLMNK